LRTDVVSDGVYYDTYLYPDAFFDDAHAENWMKLSMDSDEVAQLTEGVSDAARESQDVSTKSLSLEVARVQIIRPWFTPRVIKSRSWEWDNPSIQPISDGGSPSRMLSVWARNRRFAQPAAIVNRMSRSVH
jgi:hypothetical protein